MKMLRDDFPFLQLARQQGGVITRDQALGLGASYDIQRRRVRSGLWSWHLKCLAIGQPPRGNDWRDLWALGLVLGPDAIVTGPLAMRVHGRAVPDQDFVVWCGPSRHPSCGGVRILRDSIARSVATGPACHVADPVDALLDTLCAVDEYRSYDLLDLALQRRWISPAAWHQALIPRLGHGRTGASRLRRLSSRLERGTHSEAERRLYVLIRREGLHGWKPNLEICDRYGHPVAQLDFAHEELRLCLEVDGRSYHSDELAFERDRRRQNAVHLQGWLVLRLTWDQITRFPAQVIAQIRRAMELRERENSALPPAL